VLPDPEAPAWVNQDPILWLLGTSPGWALNFLPSGFINRALDIRQIQDRLREQFAVILQREVDLQGLPGLGPISLEMLMRNSGGARVSDESIDLLIPSILYEDNAALVCSHYTAEEPFDDKLWSTVLPEDKQDLAAGLNIGSLLDWPKLFHNLLASQRAEL